MQHEDQGPMLSNLDEVRSVFSRVKINGRNPLESWHFSVCLDFSDRNKMWIGLQGNGVTDTSDPDKRYPNFGYGSFSVELPVSTEHLLRRLYAQYAYAEQHERSERFLFDGRAVFSQHNNRTSIETPIVECGDGRVPDKTLGWQERLKRTADEPTN